MSTRHIYIAVLCDFWHTILSAIILVLPFSYPAVARRAIPNDYLAYPIFITMKTATTSGYSSGFYLNADRAIYLVTARHVLAEGLAPAESKSQTPLDGDLELLSYSKGLNRKRVLLTVNLSTLRESGDVRPYEFQDVVVVVKLATTETTANGGNTKATSFMPGVTMKEAGESGVLGVPMSAVKTFDQVPVGNDAILYGYPVLLGIPNNSQFDPFRPLLRKALVAGRDPQRRSIILEGRAYEGSSGGPVFELDPDGGGYKLIGIVIDRLGSGYSIVKPMDFILELIK